MFSIIENQGLELSFKIKTKSYALNIKATH